MSNKMNLKRYLTGSVSFHYAKWERWKGMGIDRRWSGRLIYFHIGKFYMTLDCRKNWAKDMITGEIE